MHLLLKKRNGNSTRRENICDKKAPKQWKSCIHRRLFGPKSHRIHLNPQFYLFMHENWKFLSSTTLLYFFLFSSFFGNFSKVFCEFFPSLVCFAGLMIGSSVCARSPRHMSRLWLRSVQRAAQSSSKASEWVKLLISKPRDRVRNRHQSLSKITRHSQETFF